MDIEVNRLIAIIHKKNVDLTDLETKLVNRLRWGIAVLQSKNESLIKRQVLQWWRCISKTWAPCCSDAREKIFANKHSSNMSSAY